MSKKEVDRALILEKVKDKQITLKIAASLLYLSYPQIKRIWAEYKRKGTSGLISKRRGQKSNRAVPVEVRKQIAKIIIEKYYNCKPLFVSEKLEQYHGIKKSSEFIRQLMTEYNLWIPKRTKQKVHQRRERRKCEGELIQLDASKHDWFEGRGPICHLHLLVDDATSKIMSGYFDIEETTKGYYKACEPYFENIGLPISFYSDKRGTFTVNQGVDKNNKTQFGRAMDELGIKMIFAHSPQAKGRIERTFGTLQDRLVWEMRINNISTIEEANGFLPNFFKNYNDRFGETPAGPFNAHRPLDQNKPLKYILSIREERKVSKNLEVSFNGEIYQLKLPDNSNINLKKVKINVITTMEGEIAFEYNGIYIDYVRYCEVEHQKTTFDPEKMAAKWVKSLNKGRKNIKSHPYKKKIA